LHVAYFDSYALWTYLTIPFLYAHPAFVTEELTPWQENGEEWRRLKATFPRDDRESLPRAGLVFRARRIAAQA